MLFAALRAAGNGAVVGPVVSADILGGEWPGAVALDLTTAAVFAVAMRHGVPAACVLAARPEESEAEAELGRVAASACA